MASDNTLWFEMGVRDNVSKTLEQILDLAKELGEELDEAELNRNLIRNAENLERVYDRIAVAIERVNDAKRKTNDKGELDRLREMGKQMEKMLKSFQKFEKSTAMVTESGSAAFQRLVHSFQLATEQISRYTGEIDKEAKADERAKAAEEKRVDSLQEKYYELYRVRKQLQEAVMTASPDADTADAMKMLNSLSGRIGAVKRAQANGGLMPESADGANYEEFLRRVKDKITSLGEVTSDYTHRLRENESVRQSLSRIKLDTESQTTIARINDQASAYEALSNKLAAVAQLLQEVEAEEEALSSGKLTTPTLDRATVGQRLEAIQRRYNEELAQGKALERQAAEEEKRRAEASRKAADAIQMLSHVNQNLISSYNRIAEAGSRANRVTIQFQHQLQNYASIYGLERILKSIITIGGQFEYQHMALQNILGDVHEANILFTQLQGLAIESPKTFMELTNYMKQLSAYQIPAKELFDTTKRLADLSSGLGVDMSRLILAYGQVRSAAVLRGQELRQFTEAGIPIVQALADKFTELNGKLTTTADVFKLISARKVPFEMVKEILWDMTDQGGKFFNMQAELADTLYGKWQKLQDQWQITFGHIADGTSGAGKMLKWVLELTVKLAAAFDSMAPLLASFGMLRLAKSIGGGILNKIDASNGNTAVKRMELAMQENINRLERERILYGKQLNAQEQALVASKGKLRSQEYYLLAMENQVSQKKAHQWYLDGKLKQADYERYLIMKGYTAEQAKQIMQGNTQLLQQQGMLSKMGNGLWGLIGGWPGLIITAVGAAWTAISYFDQKNDELGQKGDAMMRHAQDNANSLSKTLSNISKEETLEKKIETLEDTLIELGRSGESVVARSRENMDDINARWDSLIKGAKGYQKVLDTMGSQEGKALFQKGISDSNIENYLDKYDDAVNDAFKNRSVITKYSETFKKAVDNIIGDNEKLRESLEGKQLYEKIKAIGQKKIHDELFVNRNNTYGKIGPSAITALNQYFNGLVKVDNKWKDVKKRIPEMADELRALAESVIGKDTFDSLTPEQRDALETLTREYVSSIEKGSKEAKDKLAQELASQVFHIEIEGNLSIDTKRLKGFSKYIWEHFGGSVAGEDGKVNIGGNEYTKAQVSTVFADIDEYDRETTSAVNKLRSTQKKQKQLKDGAALVAETERQINSILSERRAIGLDDPAEKGGSKGTGTKKDLFLDSWKARVSLLDKYRKELEDLEKIMGRSAAVRKLREDGDFNSLFTYFKDPNDYIASLRKVISEFGTNPKGDRRKFVDDLGAKIGTESLRVLKDNTKDAVSELQRMLDVMSENYKTYKKWVELTGDTDLASKIAGVTRNTKYADVLTEEMRKALAKTNLALSPSDVFGLKESEAKELGEDSPIFKIWEKWQKDVEDLKKEQWSLYEEAYKGAMDYDAKIQSINRDLAREIELIGQLDISPKERERMITQRNKEADKQKSELAWKKFKEDEDFGRIFADLDRVSNDTISYMLTKLEEVAPAVDDDVESIKALYEAMEKLRDQQEKRNPFMAIGQSLKDMSLLREYQTYAGMMVANSDMARLLGVTEGSAVNFNDPKIKRKVNDAAANSGTTFEKGLKNLQTKFKLLQDALQPVVDLFDELGNTTLSDIFKAGNNALTSAANTAGAFSQLGESFGGSLGSALSSAGPYAAAAAAAIQIASTAISMFGADYSDYNKMKEQYEGLINVWDDLIDRKREYLSENWGTEAKKAGKETLDLLKSEIEQAKIVAKERLKAGKSAGSHTIGYRMWQGSYGYEGTNWKDVASSISKQLGAAFTGMSDMLDMTADQLLWIKTNYSGLWANMDKDFQEYLEAIIKYSDTEKEILDELEQKLTGMDYDEMVTSYASALSTMENTNKQLGENLEGNLKDAILNAMVANLYGDRVKNLVKKTKELGENDSKVYENGKILSEFTASEYAVIKEESDALHKEMEASRNRLKNMYGWEDSGSGANTASASIKGITENTADLLASYVNGIRLDVSVNRMTLDRILNEVMGCGELPVVAQAQLEELRMIAQNTSRNVELVSRIYDLLHGVAPDGTAVRMR